MNFKKFKEQIGMILWLVFKKGLITAKKLKKIKTKIQIKQLHIISMQNKWERTNSKSFLWWTDSLRTENNNVILW